MRYYLIGNPLCHSVSPRLHALFGNPDYGLMELAEKDLPGFLKERNFDGLNVTIPFKRAVLPFLDEVSKRAEEIGAVNTVKKRADGSLFGDNTDCAGVEYLAARRGVALYGQKILILGTGGTAHTIRYEAMRQGAREIVMVSRSGPCDYENVYLHQDADVIFNATPVGMYPDCFSCPIDVSRFPVLTGVLDAVYNPLETQLVKNARALHIRAGNGLPMLVAQARLAEEIFMGMRISEADTTRALNAIRREMTSVVLIGMPGSGKTTLGRLCAKALAREMLDTDEMIVKKTGMEIPEIFERYGERRFRELEEEAVAEAMLRGGRVVAVGGGAVMSEKNRAALRMNGRIYLIDRPLDKLDRAGRPLSKSTQVLEKMRERRAPIYRELADKTIDNTAPADAAARAITEDFNAYSGD